MRKTFRPDRFLAKKKESKIKDYSLLSEEEKLSLLREYKKMYELQLMMIEEGIDIECYESTDDYDTSSDIIENVDDIDESVEDSVIEMEIIDLNDTDLNQTEGNIEVEENRTENNNIVTSDTSSVSGNTLRREESSFDYSSFTPYKPKFDDMDLDNNMYDFERSNVATSEADEYVEKYQLKVKPYSSLKTSQDGRFKYSDSYIATKEKVNIPYFNILIVLFSVITFGINIAGAVHYFNVFDYVDCVYNLVFAISAFVLFLSAITKNNSVIKYAYIGVIVSFAVDVVIFAIERYQDYLYMVISPEKSSDKIFGIVLLITLVTRYVLFIMSMIYLSTKNSKLLYPSAIVGALATVAACVCVYFEVVNDSMVFYYDMIPASVAMITYLLSLIFVCFERENR